MYEMEFSVDDCAIRLSSRSQAWNIRGKTSMGSTHLLFGVTDIDHPSRGQLKLWPQLVGAVPAAWQQIVQCVTVPADRLRERRDVVVVMWLLERTDDTDARSTRFTVEPDEFSVVRAARYVLLFDLDVHQTVTFCHLHTFSNTWYSTKWQHLHEMANVNL